jgi:hypothetical protein
LAVFTTAPTPVVTAQPIKALISQGTLAGILIALFSEITIRSAKQPTLQNWKTDFPPSDKRVVPSSIVPAHLVALNVSHSEGRPFRQ